MKRIRCEIKWQKTVSLIRQQNHALRFQSLLQSNLSRIFSATVTGGLTHQGTNGLTRELPRLYAILACNVPQNMSMLKMFRNKYTGHVYHIFCASQLCARLILQINFI